MPSWNTAVTMPYAAPTASRFTRAACSGAITVRNASISSSMLSATTTPMISGSRSPISSARSSCWAVDPPTWASTPDSGIVVVPDLVHEVLGDLRRRRARGDHVDQRRRAVLRHLRWPDGLDALGRGEALVQLHQPRVVRAGRRLGAEVRGHDQRRVGAGAERVGQRRRRPGGSWSTPARWTGR